MSYAWEANTTQPADGWKLGKRTRYLDHVLDSAMRVLLDHRLDPDQRLHLSKAHPHLIMIKIPPTPSPPQQCIWRQNGRQSPPQLMCGQRAGTKWPPVSTSAVVNGRGQNGRQSPPQLWLTGGDKMATTFSISADLWKMYRVRVVDALHRPTPSTDRRPQLMRESALCHKMAAVHQTGGCYT